MAEIPIEKKSGGIPWWVWLIVAAMVIALLVWLFAGHDRDRGVAQTSAATGAAPPAYGADGTGAASGGTDLAATGAAAPITDLATLLNGTADAVVGRQVRLTNVAAGAVPADAGFWITGEGGKREYVILHEVRTPNTPVESKIDVVQGDRLDITGTVRLAADGVPEDAAIPGPTAPLPAGVEHYIDAGSVTKTD